jgi:hypothetical protein
MMRHHDAGVHACLLRIRGVVLLQSLELVLLLLQQLLERADTLVEGLLHLQFDGSSCLKPVSTAKARANSSNKLARVVSHLEYADEGKHLRRSDTIDVQTSQARNCYVFLPHNLLFPNVQSPGRHAQRTNDGSNRGNNKINCSRDGE